jgi:hypothetical protein
MIAVPLWSVFVGLIVAGWAVVLWLIRDAGQEGGLGGAIAGGMAAFLGLAGGIIWTLGILCVWGFVT